MMSKPGRIRASQKVSSPKPSPPAAPAPGVSRWSFPKLDAQTSASRRMAFSRNSTQCARLAHGDDCECLPVLPGMARLDGPPDGIEALHLHPFRTERRGERFGEALAPVCNRREIDFGTGPHDPEPARNRLRSRSRG